MSFTVNEAISYIENFTWSKTRLGLARTKELLDKLGNPQDSLKFIHVAGSNGKGSTCAVLECILRNAGYRTGMYTSPYIERFNEQLKVNGFSISDMELAKIVDIVAPVADSMDDHPSRFEILTAVAMIFFLRSECDVVILEVGMGGELDSTNVIKAPLVSVITNIGLEHTEFLGNTLTDIAKAKAGIIKHGAKVVCYDSGSEVIDVIRDKCLEEGCELTVTDFSKYKFLAMDYSGLSFVAPKIGLIETPLIGLHQVKNAATIIETVNSLRNLGMEISDSHILKGFEEVRWEARFEILSRDPIFVLDGAHNPQCMEALCETLRELGDIKYTIILGMLSDKDTKNMVRAILPFAKRVITIMPDSERAMDAESLAYLCNKIDDSVEAIPAASPEEALWDAIHHEDPVVACGSLYMAGAIRTEYVSTKKKAQRKICRAKRKEMTPARRSIEDGFICDKLCQIPEIKGASVIFSYMAMEEEPDLFEFHAWAMSRAIRVAFPVSKPDGTMRFYEPLSEDDFVSGINGIFEPDPDKCPELPPEIADVIVLPCLGFDKNGNRLGHGGGYYDRFIDKIENKPFTVMVGYDEQELPEIATGARDYKPDMLVRGTRD